MADLATIKAGLNAEIEMLCAELLPNGKRRGAEWCTGDVSDSPAQRQGSMRVHLTGPKVGVWSDFSSGEAGDVIDLIRAVKGFELREAIEWAKDRLGIVDPEFAERKRRAYRSPRRRDDCRTPKGPVLEYLTRERGLSAQTLKAFRIGEIAEFTFYPPSKRKESIVSPAIVFPFIVGDELKFVKYLAVDRLDGKKVQFVEADCEQVLFGWQTATGNERSVIIGEGENNAMSFFQLGQFALATPYGGGKGAKHNWIDSEWTRLEQFETIYLAFDQDDPGKAAAEELSRRLGAHRCRIVPPLPGGHKDINDWLRAGATAEEVAAHLDGATSNDPKELKRASEFADQVIDEFYSNSPELIGIDLGYEAMRDKFALRLGEVTLWTGFSKHGKTELATYTLLKLAAKGERVCLASFEMKARKTLKRAIRQITGQAEPSEKYIRQVLDWAHDRVWLYDYVGGANRKRVLEVFEYACRRYGVRWFLIDSLLKCGIREDDHDGQKEFVDDLTNFANVNNTSIFLIAHSRKKEDESRPPGKFDVRGSAAITDLVHNGITVWRNKEKEQMAEYIRNGGVATPQTEMSLAKPDAQMIVWAQREGDGYEPVVGLQFDAGESLQFAEYKGDLGRPLVSFIMDEEEEEEREPEYGDLDYYPRY